jgi:hypothetical protein
MSRLLLFGSYAMLAFLAAFAFGASGAMADPCCPAGCQKVNGTITCTSSDPVGNSENSGGQSQSRDTDTSSQGNFTNKKCSCVSGPGNQITCTPTGCR